ncbi:MAG: molybdenum cofactor biosynthesis protein MoaA [Thermofilum sp. ex4484_15]|nr:MAG: molybdenum cofactor biosynthesis protein MoaA [Thermofilum sp. ex4484_15]
MGRELLKISKDSGIPLVGHVAFGLIDRGTNLIQVRPTSLCPLSCIFCSTDAGPKSLRRISEYLVEPDYLLTWFKWVINRKGLSEVLVHIDSVGDPFTYPYLTELVRKLREIGKVTTISLETHGFLLTERIIEELEEAGLTRINLSIDAVDAELAKFLSGSRAYDVNRVIRLARYIVENTSMDLMITPVWVPGLNDREIPKIIELALKIGAGKKAPPLGIQKYEAHKYGRKPKGVKPMKWYDFYKSLKLWEAEYGVKLILSPKDFGIHRARPLPKVFSLYEVTRVRIAGPGWLRGEWLGVARGRSVAIVGVNNKPPIGREIKVKVLRVKDNIYVARVI